MLTSSIVLNSPIKTFVKIRFDRSNPFMCRGSHVLLSSQLTTQSVPCVEKSEGQERTGSRDVLAHTLTHGRWIT